MIARILENKGIAVVQNQTNSSNVRSTFKLNGTGGKKEKPNKSNNCCNN